MTSDAVMKYRLTTTARTLSHNDRILEIIRLTECTFQNPFWALFTRYNRRREAP